VFNEQIFYNRVFQLAHKGIGFMGPKPMWAVVVVSEQKIIAEAYMEKYGDASPLDKLQMFHFENHYDLYTNLLFEPALLGKLRPQKIFYSNVIPSMDLSAVFLEYQQMGIVLHQNLQQPGEVLNRSYFYFQKYKIPYSKKIPFSKELNPAFRTSFDCVVFILEVLKKSEDDDFKAFNRRTPLRILLSPFGELDFSWKVLSDDARRNTMVISTYEDVSNHPEIVRKLESLGIAQLSVEKLDEQVLLATLARYKFISVLFEV
jgi:hypothetical protein